MPACRSCCALQYNTPLSSSSTLALRASVEGGGPEAAPPPLPSPCAAAKVQGSPGLRPRASITAVGISTQQRECGRGWAGLAEVVLAAGRRQRAYLAGAQRILSTVYGST